MKLSVFLYIAYLGLCFAQLPESLVNEEKCDRISGPGTYEKLKAVDAESRTCIHELFDTTGIQNEIDKSRESGTLNKVLGRYGAKGPQVNICIKRKIEMIKLCLTSDEKRHYNTIIGILRKVADYIYENDGERVVTFVEKGGIDCLKSRLEEVGKCFGDNPLLLLDPQIDNCKDYDKIKNCVVQELEINCPSSIPANITDDLLRFAKTSICSNNKIVRSRRSLRRVIRNIGMGDKLPHIKKFLLESCKSIEANLTREMDKLDECIKEKMIFFTNKDEYINHLDKCSKPVIQLLDECLPQKLRYFPKFIFKLIDAVVRLLYNDFKVIALGLRPCVEKLKSQEVERDYQGCINRVGQNIDETIPESKAAFCAKFLPFTKCFTQEIKDNCQANDNLTKFTKDYDEAMEGACAP